MNFKILVKNLLMLTLVCQPSQIFCMFRATTQLTKRAPHNLMHSKIFARNFQFNNFKNAVRKKIDSAQDALCDTIIEPVVDTVIEPVCWGLYFGGGLGLAGGLTVGFCWSAIKSHNDTVTMPVAQAMTEAVGSKLRQAQKKQRLKKNLEQEKSSKETRA